MKISKVSLQAHWLILAAFLAILFPLVAGDAKPVMVQPGNSFTLTLDSNPTTGYRWQLANPVDEKYVKLKGSKYQGPTTKLIGAGGKETWTFEAVAEGQTEIQLNYVRPWETNTPPVKTTNFQVTVKKSGA